MKVAVLGLGSIGMRHARNLLALGHQVVAYDPRKMTCSDKRIVVMPSREAALNDPAVVAVIIASPSDQHLDDITACYQRLKPTLVEKPLATKSTDRLEKMADGPLLFVGYNLRFHAAVIQAKDWITQGQIGTPLWGTFCVGQFTKKESYLRDSVVLNWSHELDLALYLLGPAEVLAAAVRNQKGVEDWADIVLAHDSGARSIVHLDYVLDPEVRATMVVGDEGAIVIDLVRRMVALKPKGADQIVRAFNDTWDQNYLDEMQAFLARCQGKPTRGATGLEGLAVLKLCEDIRRIAV